MFLFKYICYFTVYSKFTKQAIPMFSVLSADLFTNRILNFIRLVFLLTTAYTTVKSFFNFYRRE